MIEIKKLDNGFEYVEVINNAASAKIALQGAHIFHYKRKDEDEILWLSEESDFTKGKAIRGGVPICWPSFGMNNPELSQHGFARTAIWKLVGYKDIDDNTTGVIFELTHSKKSLRLWDYKFKLTLLVMVSDTLSMELTTTNTDNKNFKITQALHSYFSVSNIDDVKIDGLDKKPYLDALTDEFLTQDGTIEFNQEVDRVYQEVNSEIILNDKHRTINIKNDGSSSVVIWNPWIEKCEKMSAMSDEAYKEFVCIESANAYEDYKIIEPNGSHTLKATIY